MLRSWYKHRKAQPMQQIVHARQLITHAELLFEDANDVATAQRAYAILLGVRTRSGKHALLEGFVLFPWQPRRPARRRLGTDRRQSVVTIHIAPALHEAARTTQHLHDRGCRLARNRQFNGAQTITLFGMSGETDQML